MMGLLDAGSVNELGQLIACAPHVPFPFAFRQQRERAESYWLDEIHGELNTVDSFGFAQRKGRDIRAFISYADSPWDTTIIRHKVAVVQQVVASDDQEIDELIGQVIVHAAGRGVECLTCKLSPLRFAAIHSLERLGFLLMDTLLEFVFDASRKESEKIQAPKGASSLSTRIAGPDDLEEVLSLCTKAFTGFVGRYGADERMPREASLQIYREWVRAAFSGWAEMILLAEIDGMVVGFGVWKKPGSLEKQHDLKIAHYSLAGVHPAFSGKGIYSALAWEGMNNALKSARFIDGPVHASNFAVHRALHRLGWSTRGARHTFHKWL